MLILIPSPIYRDCALIDLNTGSRKGHYEWPFGIKTHEWERETAIEKLMREKLPDEFQQRWVTYKGTGRNFYRGSVSFRHGEPGAILQLEPELIDRYCVQASETNVRRLYDVLVSEDSKATSDIVEKILRSVEDKAE